MHGLNLEATATKCLKLTLLLFTNNVTDASTTQNPASWSDNVNSPLVPNEEGERKDEKKRVWTHEQQVDSSGEQAQEEEAAAEDK